MASLSIAARRVALLGTFGVLFALLFASPAAAHADLRNITPANGAQLDKPPTEVQLTFTESVNLVDGGIRLVDGVAPPCPLPTRPWTGRPSPGRCRPICPRGPTSSHGGWCPPTDTRSVEHPPSVSAPPRPLCRHRTGTAGITSSDVATGLTAPWPVLSPAWPAISRSRCSPA